MKLKQLVLHHFCQHEDRTIDLSRGLVGILGPNGSGKSNLINGLIYAITGTLPNNLSQYIQRGYDSDCYVQLTFQSDLTNMTYVIKRGIQPRRAELTCVETNQTIRKSKDIDAFLIDTLKIDFNIIKNVLTVSQEDFVSFFRSTASTRAEILTRLFGFSELKTARESLRQILVSTKDNSENGAKLKAYRELLAEAERSLEPYKGLESRSEIDKKIQANIAESSQLTELSNLYATLFYFERHKQQQLDLIEETNKKITALGEVPDVSQMESEIKQEHTGLSFQENALKVGDVILELGAGTVRAQESYLSAYNGFQNVTKPLESKEEFEEIQRKAFALNLKRTELIKFKQTGCCPTCGQPFPNLDEKLAVIAKECDEANAEWSASNDIWQAYNLAQLDYQNWQKLYKDRYESLKAQVDSWVANSEASEVTETVKALPPITKSLREWVLTLKDQLTALTEKYRNRQQEVTQKEQLYDEAKKRKSTHDQLQFSLRAAERQLKELEANAPTIPEGSVPQESIAPMLQEYNEKYQELTRISEEVARADQIRDQIRDLKLKVESLEKLVKQDEEKLRYREVVSEVCEVLQNDAFLKYVMIGLLEMLTESINYYLSTFNAPFTVKIDQSSTELYCEFQNGETFVASELSGGQKMVLAISWRLALHNTFATEESCGFLTLDEPTNHLDENNIQNLTQVMAQVKQAARDRNLQVLVITHEKALEPLFDAVIRL